MSSAASFFRESSIFRSIGRSREWLASYCSKYIRNKVLKLNVPSKELYPIMQGTLAKSPLDKIAWLLSVKKAFSCIGSITGPKIKPLRGSFAINACNN